MSSGSVVKPLDAVGAAALTARIRTAVDHVWRLLHEAYEGEAWRALGYTSFRAYVAAEFDMSKSQAYRLLAKAEVVRALSASHAGDTAVEDAVATEVPSRRAPAVREAMPQARRTAGAARRRAAGKGATPAEAAAAGAKAAVGRIPQFRAPGQPDDEDRARRAAEYAERMGRPAAKPTRHCPTCTCAGRAGSPSTAGQPR